MYNGQPLSALSEAWEAVTAAKKELTNVDTKIRQSGIQTLTDTSKNVSFANPSQRSKDNPNIERRVVIDNSAQQGIYRKENVPPASFPKPKLYPDFSCKGKNVFLGRNEEVNVPARYVKDYAPDFNYIATRNAPQDKGILNSSLSGKVLLAKKNDSNALNRLKEKICQQKMNASILAGTLLQETPFPLRHAHLEADAIEMDRKELSSTEPMKRKVAHAPTAPTYKGFNQVDSHPTKPVIVNNTERKYYTKESKLQKKDKPKESKSKPKMDRKVKTKGKMQRIVSPKKPIPSITTYSWRVGQEIRENLLKERKSRKVADTQVQEEAPAVSTSLCISAENPSEKENDSSKKTNRSVTKDELPVSKEDQETIMDDVSMPSDGCQGNSKKIEDYLNEHVINDVAPVEVNNVLSTFSEDLKVDVIKRSESDMKDCKPLSENAISIINDLNSSPKDKTLSKSKKTRAVVDTGLKKRPNAKTSVPVKRKSDEDCYPKQKMRHYDQEEVQKYMQKQQAQRKQQRLKEKKEQEKRKEVQQEKLKELYNKQKEAVKESLEIGKRKVYGETFVKLSSKISSIMSNSSSYNGSQDSSDATTSKDVPTYQIPQHASSPQWRKDNTIDEIFKDSLEVTGATNGEKSIQASFQPVSPYKPSSGGITNHTDQLNIDSEKPGPSDVLSKASRVAAIHSTASALRKRLDIEAKRISCLVQNRQADLNKVHDDDADAPTVPTIMEPQGFGVEVPGTQNIDEQATLNVKLKKMEEAAKKIQSFYRGHCTRKSLHWKLPSGRTLYQAFEGARRSAFLSGSTSVTPVTLASSGYPPITISNDRDQIETSIKIAEPLQLDNSDLLTNVKKLPEVDDVHCNVSAPDTELFEMKDVTLDSSDEGGSTASLISEAMTVSKTLQQHAGKMDSRISKLSKCPSNSDGNSFPSYSGEKSESLRKVLEKHRKVPGDQYSVINIFTRNYPSLRRQQLLEDRKVSSESELDTEKIIAEAYDDELKSLKVVELDDDDLTEQSLEISLEETLVEQSLKDAAQSGVSQKDESDHSSSHKSTVTLSLADLPSKIHSKVSHSKKAGYSQDLVTKTKSLYTSEDADSDISLSSQALSSCQSIAFSDIDTQDLKPVFSSTQRSMDAKDITLERSKTLPTHVPSDEIDFNIVNAQEGKMNDINQCKEFKMSPNTLERKLKAEINLFESVGSSLQQVTEMERVRNVVDAQQEVVSLAQVLKSRQASHRQELERLSLAAKESAMASAQEVETVKRVAAEASVDVTKTIAEVKAKAAEEIAASAVQLAQIQQETTSITLKALKEVEQARQAAATVYKQSVDQQLPVGEEAVNHMKNMRAYEESFRRISSNNDGYADDFEDDKTASSSQSSGGGSTGENSTLKQTNTTSSVPVALGITTTSLPRETGSSILEATEESNHIKDVSDMSVNRTVIEESVNKTSHTGTIPEELTSKGLDTPKMSKTSHSGTITEDVTPKGFDTPKTIKTSSSGTILEDLASEGLYAPKINDSAHENGDDSQILFEQKTLSVNEDSFSGNSEEKINSSLTEEDLKHDFRMVLPSENHRRKSLDCIDNFLMTNDTSSDDIVVTPRAGGKWIKKLRSKSPFADENTFTKFTANMVRQYIQEDEVRAKHQAALLGLREKAIIEKTKAEMTYLEMQKKALKSKGTDEKMPPITKKQRAVLMRLQAEQSEIRRLKEAHKAASFERKSMLYQQKQIQKIRESTQKIWSKLEHLNKNDASPKSEENGGKSRTLFESSFTLTPDDRTRQKKENNSLSQYQDISDAPDVPDEAAHIPEHIHGSETASIEESIENEENSKTDSSSSQTATNQLEISHEISLKYKDSSRISGSKSENMPVTPKDGLSNTFQDSKEDSSIADALKKLMYKSGEKYLTGREKKLESRKHQFAEIMMRESQLKEWRQKIIEEESRLKEDIRRALHREQLKGDMTVSSSEKISKMSSKSSTNHDHSNTSISSFQSPRKEIKDGSIQGENITLSVREEYMPTKDSKTASIDESIAEQLLDDASVSQVKSANSQSLTERSGPNIMDDEKSAVSHRYSIETFADESEPSSPQKQKSAGSSSSKKVEEDSLTETTSDASDIEQRLKALQDEIESRNSELERLRKKNQKELLRLKEQELKRQLNDVEQKILRENKDISPVYMQSSTNKLIQDEESIPVALSKRQSNTWSQKTEISDVEAASHSRTSSYNSQIIQERTKSIGEEESSGHSEVHIYPSQSNRKHDTMGKHSHITSEKSVPTGTIHSIVAPDNEKYDKTSLSTVHTSEIKYTEDIKSERSRSESEHKSSLGSGSKLISSATDLRLKSTKSCDIASVSEQLLSGAKNDLILSDIVKSYGDDFEAESARDISKGREAELHSETRKSILTEDDISELSNEVLSERSNKSDKNNMSSKSDGIPTRSYRSISEALKEKSDEEHIITASSLRQSDNTSTDQSDLSVVSQKLSTIQSNLPQNEAITYEDSFISKTSKLSTALPGEASKIDSTEGVESKCLEGDMEDTTGVSDKSTTTNIVKPDISLDLGFHVNDCVIVEGIMKGVIKFLGRTPFSPVLVAGIHLDEALGTNDGTFQGSRYFNCNDNYGLFSTLDRIKHSSSEEKKDENVEDACENKSVTVTEVKYSSPESSLSNNNLIQKSPHLPSPHIPVADAKDASIDESMESFSNNKSEGESGRDIGLDFHVKSSSSSDVESLETEIPSPQKLDLNPVADSITESILKVLLREAIALPLSIVHKGTVKSSNERSEKQNELNICQQISPKPLISDSHSEPMKELPNDINTVTKQLIEDALSHMIRVKISKQEKLKQDNESHGKDLTRKSNLLSLIADEEILQRSDDGKDDILVDMDGRTVGLDDLQSVQDHLDALCGIDEDEGTANVIHQERVILPPKSFRFEEPPLQIPWTIDQTQSLVFSALNELTNDAVTHANLANVEPSTEYFSENINNKIFNEHHTILYKKLIFDSTKSILCEINEFHELQKQYKPEWMKAPRRTFTKFTRNSHMLDAASLCQAIADYISTCMDLKEGRPSLEKLKRRLPLNLNKKDYVDAVLVEEIREEEPLWVNYDEDELKVKFQLADDILNNLLEEIVDIIRI